MEYNAITAVWEITMGCNMRCKHCGSCCEDAKNNELTTEEALKLCEDIGKLGLEYVTLSGGEPTTRNDWNIIAKGLKDNNVIPTMITNGWLLDEETINKAIESGINTIAISIDGLEETHDFMRRKGSFNRSMKALELLRDKNITSAVITTISNKNLQELDEMIDIFLQKGVSTWQLQIGMPMGNLHNNKELVVKPKLVDDIIDFAYSNKNKGIRIDLADCVGYYSIKEMEVRSSDKQNGYVWNGCNAGKRSFGILCNGDILGCTSIRNNEFIEGNIREKSIIDIWNDDNSFKWSRKMKKHKLSGLCSKCGYGDICLGGCANSRLCMEGTVYGENRYCSYAIFINNKREYIASINDVRLLYEKALQLAEEKQFQLAELLIERALEISVDDSELLSIHGYLNFMLKNYEQSKRINEKLLEIGSCISYANKGLGLSLCKLGEVERGINYLERAIELCDENDMDPYHDLIVTLIEYNKGDRAKQILKEAREKSEEFYKKNIDLYNSVS